MQEVREDWIALAEPADNVFSTYEWASTWWRHFGSGRQLILRCRSSDGQVRAIVPLYRSATLPLRVARYIGHGAADQLGPVCAPQDRAATARALRAARRTLPVDVVVAEYHEQRQRWSAMCSGHVLTTAGAPLLRRDGRDWDGVMAGFSSNLRQQVRRLERKLEREHELAYRQGAAGGDLDAEMQTLFALHSERWEADETRFTGADQAFHRDFAAVAQERGWLRLWFLEADGRTVAAWHGFRFAGVEYYYQAGRDTSWEGPAVGFALLAHSIRTAIDDGVREYRFLRGDQPFKQRFANGDSDVENFAMACTTRGRVALGAAAKLPVDTLKRLRDRLRL